MWWHFCEIYSKFVQLRYFKIFRGVSCLKISCNCNLTSCGISKQHLLVPRIYFGMMQHKQSAQNKVLSCHRKFWYYELTVINTVKLINCKTLDFYYIHWHILDICIYTYIYTYICPIYIYNLCWEVWFSLDSGIKKTVGLCRVLEPSGPVISNMSTVAFCTGNWLIYLVAPQSSH